jgi:hypothetical protein
MLWVDLSFDPLGIHARTGLTTGARIREECPAHLGHAREAEVGRLGDDRGEEGALVCRLAASSSVASSLATLGKRSLSPLTSMPPLRPNQNLRSHPSVP